MDSITDKKKCTKCRKWLDRKWFYNLARSKDGLYSSCRACNSKDPIQFWVRVEKKQQGLKQCTLCKKWKSKDCFGVSYSVIGKLKSRCQVCIRDASEKRGNYSDIEIEELQKEYGNCETKCCSRCGKYLPLTDFYRDRYRLSGLASSCKSCEKKRAALYRENHLDGVKEIARQVYICRSEEKSQRAREYYINKSVCQQRNRAWKANNPTKVRIYKNKRRVRECKNGGSFTEAEWLGLCSKYDNKCLACGDIANLTIDHIIPISRGGKNDIGNIQPLCMVCNSKKGTQTVDYRKE